MSSPTIQEVTTEVKGISWFHREAGAGYPLVLLHGGGGTGKAFWYQLQGLSQSFRVLAPDLPGFGKTGFVPGALRIDDLAAALKDWCDALALERLALGGNSMGGRVSLAFALSEPARVTHLILLDAVGVLIPGLPPKNPLDIPMAQYMPSLVYDPEHYRRTTPYRSLEDAEELSNGRKTFAQYLKASPIGPDRSGDLHRADMPALLIWGRHDQIVPVEYGRVLARKMPRAELNVIETAGHLPHIEEPDTVNHLVADFLSRNPPPASAE